MDTTQRIAALCDADRRLISPILSEATKWVTIEQLQYDYACYLWLEEGKKAIAVYRELFGPALEEMTERFIKLAKVFNLALIKSIQERPRWYKSSISNNYRKFHAQPMKRRLRRRHLPREIRQSDSWVTIT